ncbi:MAG: IS5/IS1182 family transposase, partial [bacterium]|nr:IS5/IS1182 family transposase [bacterium]
MGCKALTLRLVYGPPLRQAEGFLRSPLQIAKLDLDAPDHTTLARRSRQLNV